jgi:6-phosphogluconolactonase
MTVDVQVLDEPASACARLLQDVASGGGELVLTGGSTPREAYRQAAGLDGDWSAATVWFSDERCVPPDDPRSNYGLAAGALIGPLGPRAPATVHRIPGELGPAAAADAYEQALRSAGPPRFDLVLLGLGPDAHVASLFPGQPSLSERSRLAVGVPQAGHEPYVSRVSLTLPTLVSSHRIAFLVTGASKAEAVAAAFGDGARPDPQVPASMLVPLHDAITLLLDRDAAAAL